MITVQTQDMKERICARWSLAASKVQVIPSAIGKLDFNSREEGDKGGDSSKQTSRKSRFTLCYVASPSPHKNHAILPEMMALLTKHASDAICRLTLEPRDVPDMVRRAEDLNVMQHFEFCGALPRSRVCALMSEATVNIMPSCLESFGLPYYEAMALGTAQVVADKGFAREACGDSALYADPRSAEDFAASILTLYNAPSKLDELRANARRRSLALRRSPVQVAHDYIHLLGQLL